MIEITQKIAIVGAGLCGSLLAINLAQRGFNVSVFEKRSDLRKDTGESGRSINLALSNRGIQALREVGVEKEARALCIPMEGRMIHDLEGNKRFSPYSGRKDEYINSISRTGLNALLLDKAEQYTNVDLFFEADVLQIYPEYGIIHYKYLEQELEEEYDVVLGTDGAGSRVRKGMAESIDDFQYSSELLEYGYKELEIPANVDGSFKIENNALHIWPRGNFMIIALPNLDGSFTVTMFNPYKSEVGFEAIKTDEEISKYFKKYFGDLDELLPDLQQDYDDNPVGKLGTIKCSPWHINGRTLIMGDAAHAIVPFYGQGMNASFEDVYIFDKLLTDHMNSSWGKLFESFEKARKHNTDAIADLALDNFQEMQDKVDDPAFILKRKLEMKMESTFPDYYSKYSLVTFREELSYSEALERGRAQDQYLLNMCSGEDFSIPESESDLKKIIDEMNTALS